MKKWILYFVFLFSAYGFTLEWDIGFDFQYGVFSYIDKSYTMMNFFPNFKFDNLYISIGLNFSFETNGDFLFDDWKNWKAIFSKGVNSINFHKEGFFLEIEKMDNISFEGGIVKIFNPSRFYPFYFYPSMLVGFTNNFLESIFFTENIFDFDILIFNFDLKPLFFFIDNIFKESSIILNFGFDLDPFNQSFNMNYTFDDYFTNFNVFLYSFGVNLPLLKNNFFFFSLNSFFSGIYSKGKTLSFGLDSLLFNVVFLKFKYGICEERYMPNYLDIFYDLERQNRMKILDEIDKSYNYMSINSGVSLFEKMLEIGLEYKQEYRKEGLGDAYFYVRVDKKYFKVLDLKIRYYRKNLLDINDFWLMYDKISDFSIKTDFYMSERIIFGFEYIYFFHDLMAKDLKNNFVYMSISAIL